MNPNRGKKNTYKKKAHIERKDDDASIGASKIDNINTSLDI